MSRPSDPSDPFGTGETRRRVLAAWAASPDRFREDANAEEDHALGGYRDRVVVELAQNAADAARRAGVPGRLRLTLRDRTLVAANTGAPLDAAGVAAASTLRASAKRDDRHSVGRFGVGFAAVVAVSDEPEIRSASGSVHWSRAASRDAVRDVSALAGELARREGHVPLLRLPFPGGSGPDAPPEGFDTAVVLPLRDEDAERLVYRLLGEVGAATLIALPGLEAVEVEVDGLLRELRAERDAGEVVVDVAGAATRWRTVGTSGRLDPALLADRPTEERARPYWSVTWAIPVDERGAHRPLPADLPRVVHAPTPSDERLGLPALLIASFPLAPDRRHVAPGPLTDDLLERAAEAYAELLRGLAPVPELLDLVPGPAAEGELDAKLRRAVNARLPDTAFLPIHASASDAGDPTSDVSVRQWSVGHGLTDTTRQRPRDAVAVEGPGGLVDVLAPVLPGLLPPGWPARGAALATLGVRRYGLADVVDVLAEVGRDPMWWREVYAALADAEPDPLAALPVPLADGRLVRGPRGLLLATDEIDPDVLEPLGLRVVHPDAAHPLLRRLGAIEAGPRAVLNDPRTRAAVRASYDMGDHGDDPAPVADAVLRLVAAARIAPGEEPWLADLALAGDDGDVYPAGELLLPGSPLAEVVADDAPFGVVAAELVEHHGAGVLEAVGVLRTFAVLREEDVALDPAAVEADLADELDAAEAWVDDALARVRGAGAPTPSRGSAPPMLPEVVAVRDLELVDPLRWDWGLAMLAEPPLRPAVVEPTLVVLGDGRRVEVPSYTAWWLRNHPVIGGRLPGSLRTPSADAVLGALYDEAPRGLDGELLRALGVRTSLDDLLAEPGGPDELLARLADPARAVDRATLRALLVVLAGLDPERVTPPERVRAVTTDGDVATVPADDAVVVDEPDLAPLVATRPRLPVPLALADDLADVLDVATASEAAPGEVESEGTWRPVPEVVRRLRWMLPSAPDRYRAHDRLIVDGRAVRWRCVDDVVHAADVAGLARGLAWASGRWEARLVVEAVLREPDRLAELLAEYDLDPEPPG